MKKVLYKFLLLGWLFCNFSVHAQLYKAGVGRSIITPDLPFLLTGYAGRTTPATNKIHDLWAKALVLQSSPSGKVVFITTDVLGLTPEIHKQVKDLLMKKFNFLESEIILNSSHTHSGPMVWPSLGMIGDYDSSTIKTFRNYKDFLVQSMVGAVEQAIQHPFSARLSTGHGMADFAMNRRQLVNGKIINGKNPQGSKDHDVPVLKVTDSKGNVKALLFGYACHNTTLGGTNYLINGDYAGFAQIELEKTYPGATALFFTGCAGDQNPQPRGTIELAQQHGNSLATAVKKVVSNATVPVSGPIVTAIEETTLQFVPFDAQKYMAAIISSNAYEQRRARLMLEAYNHGWDVTRYSYPVQGMRIGTSLTFVSLAGEVVVDYALQIKNMYPKENMFIAGYCNHVMCYIPTKKILEEGGYEAVDNLVFYGKPGPFAIDVEDRIFTALRSIFTILGIR